MSLLLLLGGLPQARVIITWAEIEAASEIVVPPAPPEREVGSSISGGTFSRGQWRKVKRDWAAAREAQQAALARAQRIRGYQVAKKAEAQAKAAEAAIDALELAESHRRLTELKNALDAAAGAKKLTDALKQYDRVAIISLAIVREQEEADDDDVVMLLSGLM